MDRKHIVYTVFNSVEGDSRVIKTAQAAVNSGYKATVVGVCPGREVIRKEVEGVRVVLMPNFSQELKAYQLWGGERDLRLLVGGQLKTIVPEIISLQPDLIHSHDMIGLKIGAAAVKAFLASGRAVPWVHDLHEFVAGLKGELAEKYMPICLGWEREHLREASHLVTVSDTLSAELARRYILTEPPTVIYNTPSFNVRNGSDACLRSTLNLSTDTPLVVFVGGATPLRGCDTIIESLPYLDGIHLAFVSQGKYVEELAEKAKLLGVSERFHVHPYVPSSEVSHFIRNADVGVHGLIHYPNAEVAMPNKMFEYLHAGLPMVVSDVEAMKKFVEENRVGLPFVAGDPRSCADAIERVLKNKLSFSKNITKEIKEKYSWEKQESRLSDIYSTLLARYSDKSPKEYEVEGARAWEKSETLLFESVYSNFLSREILQSNMKMLQQVIRSNKKAVKLILKDSKRSKGFIGRLKRLNQIRREGGTGYLLRYLRRRIKAKLS